MEKPLYGPRTGEDAWLWILKAFSGVLIVVILALHFVVNHLVAPSGLLSYADVLRYYQDPLIPIIEILFIVFVVTHALIGMRGIILDLKPSRVELALTNWIFVIGGGAAIVYGIWLILTIVAKGAS